MQSLLATSAALYGLDRKDQRIYQYQGPTTNEWRQIGDAARQFATNWNSLYRLDSNGDVSVFQGNIDTERNGWLLIGTQMSTLVAGGSALYATNSSSGNILRYEGRPFGWTEIGGPGSQFVTNGRHLFGLSPDRQQVNEYTDTPPGWSTVGGPMNWLFIGSNALYAIADDDNTLMRYEGAGAWVQIGEGWEKFASLDLSLYAISRDDFTVGQFDGTPGEWTQFAGNATTIAAGFHSLYIGNGEGVFQYDIVTGEDGVQQDEVDDSSTTRSAHTSEEWIWSFKTSNSYYAGYDGKITMILFSTSVFQQELKLPRKHFERGKTYFMKLQIDSDVKPLKGISLTGEENFFDEQWKLDSITAYDPSTLNLYKFRVDRKVPNSESIFIKPRSVEEVHTPPSGYVTVFVWNFMGINVAWGHASLELSDGTYISWWPAGATPETLPFLAQAEYAVSMHDAVENRTYAQDVHEEFDKDPDWHVIVGGLNESAIAKWWKKFKTTHQWSLQIQNCSTTVADALWAGGAEEHLTERESDNFHSINVWMPSDALAMAQAMTDDE
jgi:hypothetical protein